MFVWQAASNVNVLDFLGEKSRDFENGLTRLIICICGCASISPEERSSVKVNFVSIVAQYFHFPEQY